ncbi:MAG: OmpH family outer membrane protein [Chromatiales bacterium]|jgi:Skp family chaperone for outer membrane proteins|nr:OmpH family outer membrane protein [Chromatiales bacterium]
MRVALSVTIAALVLTLGGCLHEENSASIAIVDLDSVARQLGRMDTIEKQLTDTREELTTSLQAAAQELQQSVKVSETTTMANPTPQARAAHQQALAKATAHLERLKREANKRVNDTRQSLVLAFRQEARPAVDKVARERKVRVVFAQANNVIWMDKSLDITSDVLAAMGGPKG